MSLTDHYDLVIVGAGPVGISLAMALEPLPLRIALLEAKPITLSNNPETRPLALNYQSVQTLKNFGIWPELEKHATPINTVHISHKGHFGFSRIKSQEQKVTALGTVIPAGNLADTLNQWILKQSKIDLLHPIKVTNLEFNNNWRTTTESKILTADLVIAADGTQSSIRKLLNINFTEKDYQQSAISTTLTLSRSHNNIAYERFLSNGAIAMLPFNDLQVGCVWTGPTEQINNLLNISESEFLQILQEQFGFRLGRFLKTSNRTVYPLKMLAVPEPFKSNLLLIGNAAHTIHPIAAQGFNLGLGDVAELANIIKTMVNNNKKLSDPNIIKNYLLSRQPKIDWIMKFTDSLTHLFNQDFLPINMARNSYLLALDFIPVLKRRLAKRLMGK